MLPVRTLLLALVLAAAPQDPARPLVEKLRSERVDERDAAERALLAMGEAAAAELRQAAKDADLEVADRAKMLLRVLEIRRTVSPAVLKEFPGVELRLATTGHEWTRLFLEACRRDSGKRAHRSIRSADLAPLAGGAVRGAVTAEEKSSVLQLVAAYHLRPALPDLLKLLQDPDEKVRKSALHALGQSDFRDAAPAIAGLLADPEVGREAQDALIQLDNPRVVPAVVPFLRHADDSVRRMALEILKALDVHEAAKEIRPLFGDPELSVRVLAAQAAAALGDRESIPRLLELLNDPESSVVHDAALALATLGERSIIPRLRAILRESRNSSLLSGIVGAILELEATEAVPELVHMLTYPDRNQWLTGIQGLLWLRATEAAPDIRRLLSAKSPSSRQAAVEILGQLHIREAAGEIAALLDDESAVVRMEALSALEDLRATETAPAILRRLRDSSEEVRRSAAKALDRLDARAVAVPLVSAIPDFDLWSTGPRDALIRWKAPETIPELVKLLSHENAETRHFAIEVLQGMKAVEAVPEIRKRLDVPEDKDVAIAALAKLRDREVLPTLLKIVEDPDRTLWPLQAEDLAPLGEKKLIPHLIGRLRKDDQRVTAVGLLGDLHARESVAELRKYARDPQWQVRIELAQSYAKIDGPEALEATRELLYDPDCRVPLWALGALAGFEGRAGYPDLVRIALDEDSDFQARAYSIDLLVNRGARDAIPDLLTLLSSEETAVLTKAISALGQLQAKEALPRLRELLKDERRGVVLAAAHASVLLGGGDAALPALQGLLGHRSEALAAASDLARLGSTEGVPLLLRRFAPRFALNRLRQPEVWERLRSRTLPEDVQGTLRDRWERLAKEAGLKLEGVEFQKQYEEDSFLTEGLWRSGGGRVTLLDLVPENDSNYEVVLEPDRIRLVTPEEGVKIWRSWWEERRRKE